jgi:hypothetical protein
MDQGQERCAKLLIAGNDPTKLFECMVAIISSVHHRMFTVDDHQEAQQRRHQGSAYCAVHQGCAQSQSKCLHLDTRHACSWSIRPEHVSEPVPTDHGDLPPPPAPHALFVPPELVVILRVSGANELGEITPRHARPGYRYHGFDTSPVTWLKWAARLKFGSIQYGANCLPYLIRHYQASLC